MCHVVNTTGSRSLPVANSQPARRRRHELARSYHCYPATADASMLVRPRQVEWTGILHYAVHLPGYAVRDDRPQQSARHRRHPKSCRPPLRPLLARRHPGGSAGGRRRHRERPRPGGVNQRGVPLARHCRGVRALHVRYSPCLRRSHNLNYSVHFEMNCAVQFALRRSGGLTPGHILSDRMRYRGTGVGWAGKWPIRMRRFAR